MQNKISDNTGSIIASTAVGAIIGATIGGISLLCKENTSHCPSCMRHSAHSVLKKAENAMKNLRKNI